MDAKTFDMIDGMLARQGYHDDRPAAVDILELAVREGTLTDAARVVADRYALQPEVILDWFSEVLNRRVEETTQLIQKLTEMRVDNAGSK